MDIKYKWIAIIEFIAIVVLLLFLVYSTSKKSNLEETGVKGLLSLRIYSGILESKSLLIVNFQPLKEVVLEYIKNKNISASVYVVNFRDGASFGINERRGFLPASLNKVPVAILVMKKIERGELSFDTLIEIKDSDRTDTFGSLYKAKENKLPLRVLFESMLRESDNTAFNVLNHYIEQKDLQFLMGYLDYHSKDIIVSNTSINRLEFVNTKSIYNLFSSLYLSTLLKPENSEYILSLLTDTVFDIKKIANLPDNVKVAQKFGAEYIGNKKYFHSCGIMYIDRTRIFYCIMTENLSQEDATNTVKVIINLIYKYIIDIRSELDYYKSQ